MHLFARIQMRRAAVAVLSLSLYPPPHSSLSLSFASNGVPRTLARFSHALQERVRVCRHFDSFLSPFFSKSIFLLLFRGWRFRNPRFRIGISIGREDRYSRAQRSWNLESFRTIDYANEIYCARSPIAKSIGACSGSV